MKGKATIDIELLDKYRELDKALGSYKENGTFKIQTQTSNNLGIYFFNELYMDSNHKEFNEAVIDELKDLRVSSSNLYNDLRKEEEKNTELELKINKLSNENATLKESKRPVDISNWQFGLLGCAVGLVVAFLTLEVWS